LFDEYTDAEKQQAGIKSLAFHLAFQASDQTLTEEAIELESERVVSALKQSHQAKLNV